MALNAIIKKVFGSRNQRTIKKMARTVDLINALESEIKALTDAEIKSNTQKFKEKLSGGASLDDLLPEAFATVREAARRTLGMRHFDVQLMGGMALHQGQIAEMHTGEGKTLMATLAAYLNALTGQGVHVITVNDYLAQRDADWMAPVYEFLGMTVGVILSGMDKEQKQQAYAADITYGTNNEYGFDYLRDNMAFSQAEKVQGVLNFAIIDEVDSILIDEARTPLIISGPAEDSSAMYKNIDKLIPNLKRQVDEDGEGDFSVDEKTRQVFLTETGHATVESLLVQRGLLEAEDSLYAPNNISLLHHVNAALRAHAIFQRDVDYIVREGEVIIVDEHTGRTMIGRRWSDGLHQAVEAKEQVLVRNENQTLASITFQNYFRLYHKLSGMTGTADTEAYEFHEIYDLEVVVIPTNKANKRHDEEDLIFISAREKFAAVIEDIKDSVARQQPVLVGTASIDTSEYLSKMLKQKNIPHQVLNAKFHQYEAEIIAEAGRPGAVTIATNMAGRGTDIVLGGNWEAELAAAKEPSPEEEAQLRAAWEKRHQTVLEAGGLRVIGSERHESRRIDNQLRGRSGRQGDPGATRFYLSLDDDLMRRFAKPGMVNLMRKLHTQDGVPLQSGMLSKGIENAQRKVEGHNFDIRKQLLQFDDVANEQRKIIYQERAELMADDDISESIQAFQGDVLHDVVRVHIPANSLDEQWDIASLERQLENDFQLKCPIQKWLDEDNHLDDAGIINQVTQAFQSQYAAKAQLASAEVMRHFEKAVMLQTLDTQWKDHLANMDHLRQSINLRGYAQKDPKQEYKREAFTLFSDMLDRLKHSVVSTLARVQVREESDLDDMQAAPLPFADYNYQHASVNTLQSPNEDPTQAKAEDKDSVVPFVRPSPKVGRNDPCHCGSGKKYKHCHGKL